VADAERGTTITEIMAVMAITTLLGVPLLALFRTASRVEGDQATRHDARIELDWAFQAIGVELDNATPVASRPEGTGLSDTLGVRLTDEAGIQRLVYWSVDRRGLARIEVDPVTHRVVSNSTVAPGVVAGGASAFRYYDAEGAELDPSAAGAPERLADCTTLVEISLASDLASATEATTARHAVRTRAPGGNGC
jgi:hypothetical protein